MTIEPVKITDYIKTEEATNQGYGVGVSGASEKTKEVKSDELRALSVDSAYYNKKGNLSEDKDIVKDIQQSAELGSNTLNKIENVKRAWGDDATKAMEEDGNDPMDMEADALVTVVDEIKMNIAKAGGDISKMGGLSADEIEAMTESVTQAVEMENALDNSLSDEAKAYLVKNELEPTIANIYNAQYSAPENGSKTMSDEELVDLLEKLGDKLDSLIQQVEVEGEAVENPVDTKEVCGKMLSMDIPLTKNNLEYMIELEDYEKPSTDEVVQAIEDIVAEGKEPRDAYLIEGYSLMDQAREAVNQVNSIDFASLFNDVSTRRQLEEVRLTMTVEATFTMMKNGITVDTSNLQQLIDNLKLQENSLLKMLMKAETGEQTDKNVSLFEETMNNLADINSAPNVWLGSFSNINAATFTEIHQVSLSVSVEYSRMEATYEAVGTEVRGDLGDSISKAFSNVDDILDDLDMEASESNEQAVRILAYNRMEITQESVVTMKSASELVARTFKNMTPAVVAEMIKRGENPLDMKLEDLNSKTEEIKSELGSTSDSESFSKFLWKAEQAAEITDEERTSFIGVYRLLHQVEKTDGAAIGALISQGTEVTLRNLMTAVRSEKHSGREYEVSDKSGVIEEVIADMSITEQIEKVFLTNRCKDAKEAMTPAKMMVVGEEAIMEMNPDEFAQAMEQTDDEASEIAYTQHMTSELMSALNADKDVYRVLENMNIPTTANMISAVQNMMRASDPAFKRLYEKAAEQEDMDIEDLINEAYEKFAESCKTPEEMAEAEEALGVLAENVMRTMITTEEVNTIDLNGMKMVVQQCKAMGSMASSAETYHIPIMVADEAGNLNLRIVRGTGESGLIKMALYMQSTGNMASTFKYEAGEVDASITCETAQMRSMFAEAAPRIAQIMQEETGFAFKFSFANDSVDVNEIYKLEAGAYQEAEEVVEAGKKEYDTIQTEALYGIARGFIKVVGDMFS